MSSVDMKWLCHALCILLESVCRSRWTYRSLTGILESRSLNRHLPGCHTRRAMGGDIPLPDRDPRVPAL